MTHIVTVCSCLLREGTDWRVAPLKNSKKIKNVTVISNKQETCTDLQMCDQHFYLIVICLWTKTFDWYSQKHIIMV